MMRKAIRFAAERNARLTRSVRRRVPDRADDSGSLLFALLLTLIGSALASLMVPMLLVQIGSTRDEVRRAHALGAAESGINVIVGQIRAARDGSGNGVLSELPCGTLSGTADAGDGSRYQVTVSYFPSDPKGQTSTWLSANAIQCLTGAGARSAPAYALIQSQGTDTTTGSFGSVQVRSLQATYIFQTTNQNITGGLIHIYNNGSNQDLCIDAGSGSPTAGTSVTMQPCSPGSLSQTFGYETDLNLEQMSSGLCLDAGTPEASGAVVKLQACVTPAVPQQEWSLNDSANFAGTSDGSTLNSFCFNVQTPNVVGSLLILSTNCNGAYDDIQTFSPEAAVGAGAAGPSTSQLVNFNQFGRCLDVTNFDVNYAYLIDWPCKQAPNPNNIGWNQRWTVPKITGTATSASGQITTNDTSNSTTYCLVSPLSTVSGYVTVSPCPATGTPINMNWTIYGATGTYSTSYEIVDNAGNCLSPTDPNATPPDLFSGGNKISKMVVSVCSGSTLQKWNAPPNVLQPTPLKDVGEH